MRPRSARLLGAAALALFLAPSVRAAQEEAATEPAESSEEERFFEVRVDDLVGEQLETWEVPGAVVALVEAGEARLVKGYGVTARPDGPPMDGAATVVHAGSLSKPLTAMALLQLAERGRLDLDADVNRYLRRVGLEPTFTTPITAAHLLTHTAGLDERNLARKARSAAELLPLADYLALRLPPRVRPPGRVSIYSNHGYALAGLLVEEVAGRPFADYIQAEIFDPLGMASSAFAVTPPLAGRLATGHAWRDGAPLPLDFIQTAPASMLLTTAADMGRWMTAVLEGGALGEARVLQPETARLMLERQFANHPGLPGRSFGLSEGERYEPAELLHSGGASGFTSALVLLPARRVGLFVCYNRQAFVWELVERILDRLDESAGRRQPVTATAAAPVDVERYAGYYRNAALPASTVESLASLVRQRRLRADPPAIEWSGERYLPAGDGLFRSERRSLAFGEEGGEVRWLFAPGSVWERVPRTASQPVQLALAGAFAATFVVSALGWAGALLRRKRRDLEAVWRSGARWPLRAAQGAALLDLVFVAALGIVLAGNLGGGALEYGIPDALYAVMVVPLLAGLLAVGGAIGAACAWFLGWWDRATRLRLTGVCLALLAFLPFLDRWNLLGFRF